MAAGTRSTKKQTQPTEHTTKPQSREVIAVGCKLPHGLHMDFRVPGLPTERVTLKGTNSLQTGLIRVSMIGGFAVTENVPKEFFDRWLKANENHPAVKNGLIFAHKQVASVVDMGKEREADVHHGFDPLDPHKKVKDATGRVTVETRTEDD